MNSSFIPGTQVQFALDSTSYKSLKTCPFKYYLEHIHNWTPKKTSVHLIFGIAFHSAVEQYHRLRAEGTDHGKALHTVVAGMYYRQLKTAQEKEFDRGFHELSIPEGIPAKTATTLLRTIVWYLDEFQDDPAKTFILSNGKPAVELSFSFPLGFEAGDGYEYLYCGHFDRIVEYNDQLWVTDYKTTTGQLNMQYFAQYSPDIQMTGYTLASQIVFNAPAKGVMVDAAQLGVTYSTFARQPIQRTASQLEEFLDDMRLDLRVARVYAEEGSWPQNPTACHHFGGCAFRKVCSHPPSVRENFLKADFTKRTWDPLKAR